MYERKLVPDDFVVPVRVETEQFVIVPLGIRQMSRDMEAVPHGDVGRHMNASNHERFGRELSVEDQNANPWMMAMAAADHAFARREDFYYAILSPDESIELGCVYVSPTPKADFDAEVVIWVRDEDNNKALDEAVYSFVQDWVRDVWPLKNPAFPGRRESWETWGSLPDQNPARWDEHPVKTVLVPRRIVPLDFDAPEQVDTERFKLRPLDFEVFGIDTEACLASTDAIRQQLPILGNDWPASAFDAEEYFRRIAAEMKDRVFRHGFGYSIMTPGSLDFSLGALHIKPSQKAGCEAEVYFWVRGSELDTDLQQVVLDFTKQWLADAWPFDMDKVLWPGRTISWDDWRALPDVEPPA